MPTSSFAVRAAALVVASLPLLAGAAEPTRRSWDFAALLDERPIGQHRFLLESDAANLRSLSSEARFDVKLLGLTVYRYRFRADERWSGDCLQSLAARSDDDGKVVEVRAQAAAGALAIDTTAPPAAARREAVPGCVMSFAYWNPALAGQRRLLDPGSGRVEAVEISPLPETTIVVRGRPSAVRGLRIAGLAHPIDVWYAGDDWVGLDTVVAGGRRLSYRLP